MNSSLQTAFESNSSGEGQRGPMRCAFTLLKLLAAIVLIFILVGAGGCPEGASSGGPAIHLTSLTPDRTTALRPGEPAKTIAIDLRGSGFPVNPHVNATRGVTVSNVQRISSSHITANFEVSATEPSSSPITVSAGGDKSNQINFEITDPDAQPSFSFSADPDHVETANGVESPQVRFVLNSQGGFAGPVRVSWATSGQASPQPTSNGFIMHVQTSPSVVYFWRTFLRTTTGNEDIPITFTATSDTLAISKTATVIVKHQAPTPSFGLTASTTDVNCPIHAPSELVTFTVTAANGFTGQVQVGYEAAGDPDVSIYPPNAIPVVTLTAAQPSATVEVGFYWNSSTHPKTTTIRFNARALQGEPRYQYVTLTLHLVASELGQAMGAGLGAGTLEQ